ncbi:AraC family transcriptional regulator [Mycobacterium sp. SVM_VP21]|nr:AraC family transcriptional regulator [Mycobacterium sp. SVM_VP21]
MYQEFRPEQRLREFVECGWVLPAPSDRATRVLPDGCVDLFVTGRGEILVAGPATRHYEVSSDTEGVLAGLRLRPGAVGSVLGRPAGELRDARIPFDSEFGADGRRAVEKLFGTPSPRQRTGLLENLLAAYLTNVDPLLDRPIAHAVQILRRRPDLPVTMLAAEVGFSERQLRRRFDAAVGYGPKRLSRVLRFQRLLELLHATDGPPRWAELAMASGYADQSHMINECVALAGVPPTALPAGASVSSNTAEPRSP